MTQFALVKTSNRCSSLRAVETLNDSFLSRAASKLFPDSPIDQVFVISAEGKSIDSLMLDAQKQVFQSSKIEGTELFSAINEIAKTAEELIFWYGSDYDDLDCLYDISAFLRELEASVHDSVCELYVHYKNTKL